MYKLKLHISIKRNHFIQKIIASDLNCFQLEQF